MLFQFVQQNFNFSVGLRPADSTSTEIFLLLNGVLCFKDLKIAWIFYFFKIFTSIITFYGANFEFNEYFTHVENLTIAGSVVDKKTIAIIVAMVNLNFKILILLLTFEFKIVCKN